MKRLFIAPLLFLSLFSASQTVEDIIQQYTAAMGGLEKFKSVKTAVLKGNVHQQGMDFPITTFIITDKAVKTEVSVQGMKVIECYKDGKGWSLNPVARINTPKDATEEELKKRAKQTQLSGNLMNYKARNNTVKLVGPQTIEGIETHQIKVTSPDGGVVNYFIMDDSHLILKTIERIKINGADVDLDVFYSNFKEINGMKFPFDQVQKIGDQVLLEIGLDSIELDKNIDEKIFDKTST